LQALLDQVRAHAAGLGSDQLIVADPRNQTSEAESGDDRDDLELGVLSAIVPIRHELMADDFRALYVAWRLRVQVDISGSLDFDTRRIARITTVAAQTQNTRCRRRRSRHAG
jgi:hypothetical protein